MIKEAILHFKKVDPTLHKIAVKTRRGDLKPTSDDHFTRLVRSIISQQLSVKAAATIYSRFISLFTDGKISPEKILRTSDEDLRKCGISFPKIKYIKDLADKVYNKNLILEKIHEKEDEEIKSNLIAVKGIGPWSAEMFLMFSLGRPDIFSAGDVGLQNAIKKLYKIEKPTTEQLLEISSKWSPYRTYACMILWESLDNEPK